MTKRIEDIEVLRAFAVLWVVIHHMHDSLIVWKPEWLEQFFAYFGGWSGVDMFFAISGFVIAKDLVPRLQAHNDRGTFLRHAIAFWMRRAWRLLPSAWLCLAFIVLASVVFNSSGVFGTVRANAAGAISAMLQIANFHFASTFGTTFGLGATFHFWSLSLEEQFYLALPFAIYFGRRALPWLLGVIVIYQLLAVRVSLYAWMLRTDAMLLGVLIALWSTTPSYRVFEPVFLRGRPLLGVAVLLFLTLAVSFAASAELNVISQRLSLIAVLSALLVFIASFDQDYLMPAGFIKRVFIWIGARSYAMYLWHVPVFFAVRELAQRYSNLTGYTFNETHIPHFIAAGALLLTTISELNYRFVEMPLRARGAAATQRWLAGNAAA